MASETVPASTGSNDQLRKASLKDQRIAWSSSTTSIFSLAVFRGIELQSVHYHGRAGNVISLYSLGRAIEKGEHQRCAMKQPGATPQVTCFYITRLWR